jgi:hypothetical protein
MEFETNVSIMKKGIIYCTNNKSLEPPIIERVQYQILKSNLPITSVSLQPINFGENVVLEGRKSGSYTLILQIILGLETSKADQIFFCEHDVLYHPTYFDFIIKSEDVFYYNAKVVKWGWNSELTVTHNGLISFSELSCNRLYALEHFKKRKEYIDDRGWETDNPRESWWSRRIGYEPGFKPLSKEERCKIYEAQYPNIDIRHKFCFSNKKMRLDQFNRPPIDSWKEGNINKVEGWNIKSLFSL